MSSTRKALCVSTLAASIFVSCGPAQAPVEPTTPTAPQPSVLADQEFLSVNYTTAANPWPDLNVATPDQDALQLKVWLLAHQPELRTWPPRFESDQQAEQTIVEWRRLKSTAETLNPRAQTEESVFLLLTTFWFFGHNIDEADSILRAHELVDQARTAFPDSPLPPTLKGLLELNTTRTADSEALFTEALGKNPDAHLQYVLHLGLSAICYNTNQSHKSLISNQAALQACRECRDGCPEIHEIVERQFRSSTEERIASELLYYLEGSTFGSRYFGYELTLPDGWTIHKASDFDPRRGSSVVFIDAPPLEPSGMIHGITIIAFIDTPQLEGKSPALESMARQGARFQAIDPLENSPWLDRWSLVETDHLVGDDDVIQMFVASGSVDATGWTEEEHLQQAAAEGACRIVETAGSPGSTAYRHQPPRVSAPVRLDILYSASKATLNTARDQFPRILRTLKIEKRANSQLIF